MKPGLLDVLTLPRAATAKQSTRKVVRWDILQLWGSCNFWQLFFIICIDRGREISGLFCLSQEGSQKKNQASNPRKSSSLCIHSPFCWELQDAGNLWGLVQPLFAHPLLVMIRLCKSNKSPSEDCLWIIQGRRPRYWGLGECESCRLTVIDSEMAGPIWVKLSGII